jgi:hypothetical protein
MVDLIRGLKGLPEWIRPHEYAHDQRVELRRVTAWSMWPVETYAEISSNAAERLWKVVPNLAAAAVRHAMRGGGRRGINRVPEGNVNVAFTGEWSLQSVGTDFRG